MYISAGFTPNGKFMLNPRQQQYLQWMGIDYWQQRYPQSVEISSAKIISENEEDTQKSAVVLTSSPVTRPDWPRLIAEVAACTACPLHCSRSQTVFGTGNFQARVMFIGEAPGAEEDRQGKPFVGRAGQLLTEMLRAIGLTRDEVFIANILKCRPPNNRDPLPEEVQQCTPFLQQQISWIQPQLLVALGRISAHFLLKTTTSLSRLRGQQYTWGTQQTPLMVTYHPAYLLRSPQDKAKAYEDLLQIKRYLRDNFTT